MTFKDQLLNLAKLASKKATIIQEIEKELEHDGFSKFSIMDYQRALDEHRNAVNKRGELVSRMIRENIKQDDDFFET